MAVPTKAQITYQLPSGQENVLRFHSVIAEEHLVEADLTEFPVQSRAFVTNHSIRKGRQVKIRAMVSNTIVADTGEAHSYGQNNSKLIKAELSRLITEAVPCTVQTNLGTYDPVIFKRFKTKQEAGMMDSIDFTIEGKEVIIGDSVNSTTPVQLVFQPVPEAERAAIVTSLAEAGITVEPSATIETAPVDINGSFQVDTLNNAGQSVVVTYEKSSFDETTEAYNHTVHTSETEVKSNEVAEVESFPFLDAALAGVSVSAACLSDGLIGIAQDIVNEQVDTALGELRRTAYGAAYKLFGVNGNRDFGQVLLGLGVDCLVAGAIGGTTGRLTPDDYQDNPLPTSDDMLEGAAGVGDQAVSNTLGAAAPTTLTKISGGTGETSLFSDAI